MTRTHVKTYSTLTADPTKHTAKLTYQHLLRHPLAVIVILFAALLWSYWPTVFDLFGEWQRNEDYSVGQLVPFVAVYFIWMRRRQLARFQFTPCWWGLGVIFLGLAARAYGLMYVYESIERYSLVLTIVGVTLFVAGWQTFYQLRWIMLFLFLMVPFPGRIHNLISGPLQTLATICSVFTLELLGISVVREGHIIVVNDDVPLAVAEACSGLRMLTAFIVVSAAFAYVVNRPRWQKFTLLISCIPVAIFCNLIRLIITALLFMSFSSELADRFFHDFAGWTMMPLAIIVLVGELWIMSKLIIQED